MKWRTPKTMLNDKEEMVVQLLLAGKNISQIASILENPEEEIQKELQKIYERLGVESKLELLVVYKKIKMDS